MVYINNAQSIVAQKYIMIHLNIEVLSGLYDFVEYKRIKFPVWSILC